MIKVDSPKFTATIYKRIQRSSAGVSQRYVDARRELDLTPFLGEGCAIETQKNIRQPAGAFAITIVDQPDLRPGGIADTLYSFIEPMDYVEIRGARHPEAYRGTLPIIMRGWVTDISRGEQMGGDGRPVRRVVISGQDYGKIPQMYQLLLALQFAPGAQYLTNQRLWSVHDVPVWFGASDFVASIVDHLLNPFLTEMAAVTDTGGQIPLFGKALTVESGLVYLPMPAQQWNDSAWALMTSWTDLAWNELFIDEGDTQPLIVYRPIPYYNAASVIANTPTAVNGGGPLPFNDVRLTEDDLVAVSLTRSDRNVANFYWVEAPWSSLNSNQFIAPASLALGGGGIVGHDTNADPDLYGQRKLEARTQQVDGRAEAPTQQWFVQRRTQLANLNVDNVVWESGTLTVKGNEQVRPGRYLRVSRGELKSLYYVVGVSHRFAPYQPFTTTLSVDRGTGFLERRRRSKSPWAAEGRKGPYRE